ncbi:autotransporter domain-containing protein [Ochrobactrum sp. Q0168]|uniref:autotransporter outer membrane beta-barrel domain-containing protein n=1 Tax=Ochrobactrum sp. Q0168 TaxID=2793241 RepID=UPI0018EB7731|nr:autotransporter domain-containing protein [Ochrobactrum sp. Q0168]
MLNATATNAISGGTQAFYDSSALNVTAMNGVSGGSQYFNGSSSLNASEIFSISGGGQSFYDASALNASASNAVSNGFQYFNASSRLDVIAAGALSGGQQVFYDTSTLNASAADAIVGGSQFFNGSSRLNATASSAVNGGTQSFYVNSVMALTAANALSGGEQYFNGNSALNVSVGGAVGGGAQYFYNLSALNASAANAVNGGARDFHDSSVFNVSATSGLSGGAQTFYGNSTLNVLATNAVTSGVGVNFDNLPGGVGGTIKLNGFSTTVGAINSIGPGAGLIENGAATSSVLTIDGSSVGPSLFSGVIQDGGSGRLALELNSGTLTLSGPNSFTGGTTITGGVLQVSSDVNLGDPSGGLILNDGTLATTASFQTARSITLAQAGIFDVADNTDLILNGALSGPGDLVKTGTGVLQLTNTGNRYSDTIVGSGRLVGNSETIKGNIANAGIVVFAQAADGNFAGDIAGAGGVAGTMIKEGSGSLMLSGTSGLNWIVQHGNLTSSAERFSGDVSIAAPAAVTFDQVTSAQFTGLLTGEGTFIKAGLGTLAYNGKSPAFTGTTAVSAGGLIVGSDDSHSNAVLGGSFIIADGGLIGGHGTIGSGSGSMVDVLTGATLSSGNSIGTLTINGDLTLERGSTYAVDIADAGLSDLTRVSGKTTISGGNIDVTALDPATSYQNGQTYTILTSDGGINGAFQDTVSKSAFITANETYDLNSVHLTIAVKNVGQTGGGGVGPISGPPPPALFETVSETRNQTATAKALDTLQQSGPPLELYNRLLMLSAVEARGAFNLLSGEAYASTKAALIEGGAVIRDAMNNRLRSTESFVLPSSATLLSYGPENDQIADTPGAFAATTSTSREQNYNAWIQGYGNWASIDGSGNTARLDYNTGGFVVGVDGTVFDNWRLGLLAGYSRTTFDVDGRASSGQSDNYTLGAYAGSSWKLNNGNAIAFRTGLAYTWHEIELDRSVTFPGFSDSLNSDYHASTFQAFGELAYQWGREDAPLEAFANLAYVHHHTDGFNETGRTAVRLNFDSDTMDTAFTTIGLRASRHFLLGNISANAYGSIGWRHAYGDIETSSTNSFIGSSAFTVYGAPIAKDAALIEAGLNFDLSRSATLGVNYTGQIGSHAYQQGVNAVLRVRF